MNLLENLKKMEVSNLENGIYTIRNIYNNKIIKIDENQFLELKVNIELHRELMRMGYFDTSNNETPLFKKKEYNFFNYENVQGHRANSIGIIGIPYDASSTGVTGSSRAPQTLRKLTSGYSNVSRTLDLNGAYKEFNHLDPVFEEDILDCGDILHIPGESNEDMYTRIKRAVEYLRSYHGIEQLISIGGDHSCTLPLVQSLTNKDVIVVKLDAHFDNIDKASYDKTNHANFVKEITQLNNVKKVVHIGVRENLYKKSISDKEIFISANQVKKINEISKELKELSGNIYLSFDFDVLDPNLFGATSFLLPFGLKEADVKFIFNILAEFNIVGIDLMEYNPILDQSSRDKHVCLEILKESINMLLKKRGKSYE